MARSASIVKTWGMLPVGSTGAYLGAEDMTTNGGGNFTGATGVETLTGVKMAIKRQHYGWLVSYPTAFETGVVAQRSPRCISMVCQAGYGSFPMITANPNGSSNTAAWKDSTGTNRFGMDQIIYGRWDAQFTKQFQDLQALGAPILYNLFFEFDGQHNNYFPSWQGGVGTAKFSRGAGEARFAAAWQHIWNLADAAGFTLNSGGNGIFIWCSQQGTTSPMYWENSYPGDQYVDWIGHDLYRHTISSGMDAAAQDTGFGDNKHLSFAAGTMSGSSAVGRGSTPMPVIICEGGYSQGSNYTDGTGTYAKGNTQAAGNIMDHIWDQMVNTYPDIVAYVHWNESGGFDDRIDETASATAVKNSIAGYTRFFSNTLYYGGGGGGVAPNTPSITAASKPTNPTNNTSNTFVWTVTDTPDHYHYRVTVDGVAGSWVTTSALNSGLLQFPAGHTYKFEVQAGNVSNQYSASDSYTFAVNTVVGSVATPVLTVKPTAANLGSTGSTTAAFMWTEANADANYRYFCKVDTPSGTGTYPVSGRTEKLYNVPGSPLQPGTYKFYVKAWNGSQYSAEATWTWTVTAVTLGAKPVNFTTVPPDPDTSASPQFAWTQP